jgi:hypothetical protein
MTNFTLNDQQRQDLAILAGEDADEDIASRAQMLLSDNKEAVAYFETLQRMTRLLDTQLAFPDTEGTSDFLTDDRVRLLAGQIRARAARRRPWFFRPWAIAAGILMIVGSAAVISRPLFRSRVFATVHLFPLGGQLSSVAPDRWYSLRAKQVLSTQNEVAVITLPEQKVIIVGPESAIQCDRQTITLVKGMCYVNGAGFLILSGESRIQSSGELIVSDEGKDSYVNVYSGHVWIDGHPPQVVQGGQHAVLLPFEQTEMTLKPPYWVRFALDRAKEIQ